MRTKIKKLISIKGTPLLALTLLILSGLALAAGREPVSISGQVILTPEPPFFGEATMTIGCDTVSGSVMVVPLAPPIYKDGAAYFPVVEHWFTFDNGNLITTGEEFAIPTDENPAVYTLHGNMEVIPESAHPEGPSATGEFEGASGELRVNGQMDWSVGQATFQANGAICR